MATARKGEKLAIVIGMGESSHTSITHQLDFSVQTWGVIAAVTFLPDGCWVYEERDARTGELRQQQKGKTDEERDGKEV